MKKHFLLLLFFIGTTTFAQRWYAINDLTTYNYQNLDITVDRHKVYLNTNNNLTLIRDFDINNTEIPEDYIRDFDFIDADTWYVLVGSRYIGTQTELYKTEDAGTNWELIVPEALTAPSPIDSTANNINQVQFLNGRIYLFDTYYTSRVFYSDDLGQTWTHWFEGFWSHYYQMYACGSDLYLHGLPGDGFPAYMFKIPQRFIGLQNVLESTISECVNGNGEDCYYAPANITVPAIYNHFKDLFETTICNTLEIIDSDVNEVKIYPNPVIHSISLEGIDTAIPFSISVYNSLGQKCLEDKNNLIIDLTSFKSGIYFMKVTQNKITKTIKVIKQ